MKLQQRSFSGKIFRPAPEVRNEEELGLLIVCTPWGAREGATRVADTIKEYLVALRSDTDATSPFPRLTCLSTNANNLRIAAMLANEQLYREENSTEYVTGVELFAFSIVERELSWIQLGHPNVFLKRPKRGILPLGCHLDLPMDISGSGRLLPPLPSSVLGLDASANFLVGSFIPQPGDQLIMTSRSSLPHSFFQIGENEYTLPKMTKVLAEDDADSAFWLGLLTLEK